MLLDLIDKLKNHITLIQSNTDGVFFSVKNYEEAELCKEIAKEWEQRTRLVLEWDEYTKIVQKDVNNYILIDKDGHYKSKGAYLKKLSSIDSDLLILNKALIDYFINGTSIEDTINNSTQLSDFQKIVKITALYKHALHGNKKIKEKVLRVFASKDENAPQVYKVKSEDKIEKIANTPDHCFILNDNIQDNSIPEELDKEYYISEANKRLHDFFNPERKVSTKPKSEIKGVNEEVYNAIVDLDLGEFETFIDTLVYIRTNSIANKTQVGILTKLNFFDKFGKNKKLSAIVDEFYDGELKFKKSKIEERQRENIEALKEFESQQKNEEFSVKETIDIRQKYLGYFITKEEKDRTTFIISRIQDTKRKSDGKCFGKSVKAMSYGSGKENWYTILNRHYDQCGELQEGSILKCTKKPIRQNGFWHIENYSVLNF